MSDETPMSEGSGGFEIETGGIGDGASRQPMVARRDKSAERAANLKNTFGQGPGRIAMIAVVAVLLVFLMLGIRSCSHTKAAAKSDASMDVPGAPPAQLSTKPVAPEEVKRHAEQAAREAAAAQAQGKDYQSSFDPIIAKNKASGAINSNVPAASFDVDGVDTGHPAHAANTTSGQGGNPQAVNGLVPIGGVAAANDSSGAANGYGGDPAAPAAPVANAEQTPEQQKAQQDAEKAHMDAFNKAVTDRDLWVSKTRDRVVSEAEEILGGGKDGEQIKYSGYRAFSYANESKSAAAGATATADSAKGGDGKGSQTVASKGPLLIKTGNSLFITTNSLVNTDHGGQLFGTVRSGTWDGSQVICSIEQAPDNIRAHCTTLAPQDSRPTMKIDAVLLRESDMAQGIAESTNHHVISRYSALAVASLLQGYGEAYSYQQGTSVVTANGTVLQTDQAPNTKQVVGRALGQVGTNAGSEIMKGFDRPTTYTTPPDQGMVLYFLTDVYAPSAAQP